MTLRKGLAIAGGASVLSMAAVSLAWAVGQHTVDQAKLQFSVAELVVKRGASVTFRNLDRTSHNIQVSGGMTFDGGLQKPQQNIDVLFAKSGTYAVTCGIHPKMALTVRAQ